MPADVFSTILVDEKKYFAENFNSMLKFNSLEAVSSLVKDEDAPHLTTYLLDLQCNNSKAFMEASETRKFFQHPYRWVIFGSVLSQVPEIETLIDSNVLFVEKNFQLWNCKYNNTLAKQNSTHMTTWEPIYFLSCSPRSPLLGLNTQVF